jgi:DNA-binding IclR family transcriptional regulator
MESYMKSQKIKHPSGILVLHKALDLVEAIRDTPSGLSLADLARTLDLPKPTAYRILATLESRGYLDRNGLQYRMSRKITELQRGITEGPQLSEIAWPLMQKLVTSCKETVNLGILDAGEVVVISTIESLQSIRMTSKIGNRRCLHSTALGKVLLSGLQDREVRRLLRLKKLPRLTQRTITSQAALMIEIHRVREQGFALDNEENEADGRCIGAPICGPNNHVIAALSISAPVFRMDMNRVNDLAIELKEACCTISRAAGG